MLNPAFGHHRPEARELSACGADLKTQRIELTLAPDALFLGRGQNGCKALALAAERLDFGEKLRTLGHATLLSFADRRENGVLGSQGIVRMLDLADPLILWVGDDGNVAGLYGTDVSKDTGEIEIQTRD